MSIQEHIIDRSSTASAKLTEEKDDLQKESKAARLRNKKDSRREEGGGRVRVVARCEDSQTPRSNKRFHCLQS